MNYFVSIENNFYHSWQIELLIKSFKEKSLQDNLYISIATTSIDYFPYGKNLLNHKNKFFHKKIKSYSKANKWFSLNNLIKNKSISQPITVIDPCFIFFEEPKNLETEFTYQQDYSFNYKNIINYIDFKKYFKGVNENIFFCLGDTFIFNNVKEEIFEDINLNLLLLSEEKFTFKDKIALLFTLWKNKISISKTDFLESKMIDNEIYNFINYDHGVQPHFNKRWFKNKNFFLSGSSPIELLSTLRVTKCCDYISSLSKNL